MHLNCPIFNKQGSEGRVVAINFNSLSNCICERKSLRMYKPTYIHEKVFVLTMLCFFSFITNELHQTPLASTDVRYLRGPALREEEEIQIMYCICYLV